MVCEFSVWIEPETVWGGVDGPLEGKWMGEIVILNMAAVGMGVVSSVILILLIYCYSSYCILN